MFSYVMQKYKRIRFYSELRKTYRFLYIQKYGAIFLHIPKAAGTSIYLNMFNTLGGGHMSAKEYLNMYGVAKYSAYFKFTFVRNPYHRVYSAYNFLLQGGVNSSDEKFAKLHLSQFENFEDFVLNGLDKSQDIQKWIHFVPQYEFVCIDGNLAVDFVGRYENIEKDYKYIANVLGIEKKLTHLNSSSGSKENKEVYNSKMAYVIEKIYKKDFELFNYPIGLL